MEHSWTSSSKLDAARFSKFLEELRKQGVSSVILNLLEKKIGPSSFPEKTLAWLLRGEEFCQTVRNICHSSFCILRCFVMDYFDPTISKDNQRKCFPLPLSFNFPASPRAPSTSSPTNVSCAPALAHRTLTSQSNSYSKQDNIQIPAGQRTFAPSRTHPPLPTSLSSLPTPSFPSIHWEVQEDDISATSAGALVMPTDDMYVSNTKGFSAYIASLCGPDFQEHCDNLFLKLNPTESVFLPGFNLSAAVIAANWGDISRRNEQAALVCKTLGGVISLLQEHRIHSLAIPFPLEWWNTFSSLQHQQGFVYLFLKCLNSVCLNRPGPLSIYIYPESRPNVDYAIKMSIATAFQGRKDGVDSIDCSFPRINKTATPAHHEIEREPSLEIMKEEKEDEGSMNEGSSDQDLQADSSVSYSSNLMQAIAEAETGQDSNCCRNQNNRSEHSSLKSSKKRKRKIAHKNKRKKNGQSGQNSTPEERAATDTNNARAEANKLSSASTTPSPSLSSTNTLDSPETQANSETAFSSSPPTTTFPTSSDSSSFSRSSPSHGSMTASEDTNQKGKECELNDKNFPQLAVQEKETPKIKKQTRVLDKNDSATKPRCPYATMAYSSSTEKMGSSSEEKAWNAVSVLPLRFFCGQTEALVVVTPRHAVVRGNNRKETIFEYATITSSKAHTGYRSSSLHTAQSQFFRSVGQTHDLFRSSSARAVWLPSVLTICYIAPLSHWKVPQDKVSHLEWLPFERLVATPFLKQGYRLSSELQTVLHAPQERKAVLDASFQTQQYLFCEAQNSLLKEINSMYHQVSLQEQLELFFPEKWQLSLKTPKIPVMNIIVPLQANSKEYQEVKTHFAGMVEPVSIRKLNLALIGDRNRTPTANETVVYPIFHGTPNRWRATCIALSGFNLGIRLHGRALGDGVYTAHASQVSAGYSQTGGSILVAKGYLKQNYSNLTPQTRQSTGVRVFADPKDVVPLYLVDFAPSDARDAAEAMKDKGVSDDRALRKLKAHLRETQEKERIFLNSFRERVKKQFLHREKVQGGLKAVVENMSFEAKEGVFLAELQIRKEKQQECSPLPIHMEKDAIINAIKTHAVVVLTSATGTGKSTQIPQYLYYLKKEEEIAQQHKSGTVFRRTICVLEPRRAVVRQVGRRVASEMGVKWGNLVGYSLGRGESNASEETEIEFMTHGLFLRRCLTDANYCSTLYAVVVDEAHFRSLEIDFSLMLLREHNLSLSDAGDPLSDCKVVVMSASIESEVDSFLDYLSPPKSPIRSRHIHVEGIQFPVLSLDWTTTQLKESTLGTQANGTLLTYVAIEAVWSLLSQTTEGNILVFVPGTAEVEKGIDAFDALKNTSTEEPMQEVLQNTEKLQSITLAHMKHVGSNWQNHIHTSGVRINMKMDETQFQAVWVCPFHSGVPATTQKYLFDSMQYNESGKTPVRTVIFATAIAETGHTFPNIRYIVDTGLEKQTVFNAQSTMNELHVAPISRSTMLQRKGRAGRQASGIYVHLFDPDRPERVARSPIGVKQGNVMDMLLVFSSQNKKMPLMDPIPEEREAQAKRSLILLEAAKESKTNVTGLELTEVGQIAIHLGASIRIARFIAACNAQGCLLSGLKLAAVLSLEFKATTLLPPRDFLRSRLDADKLREGAIFDTDSDHLSLLAIFDQYLSQKLPKTEDLTACLLAEAKVVFEHFMRVADETLGFELIDTVSNEDLLDEILISLSAGFFDHVALFREPGVPKEGFERVFSDDKFKQMRAAVTKFIANTCGDVGEKSLSQATTLQGNRNNGYCSLNQRSALWGMIKEPHKDIVLFSNIVLVDGDTPRPTINIASCVTADHVQKGAEVWFKEVNFGAYLKDNAKIERTIPISQDLRDHLLMKSKCRLPRLKAEIRGLVKLSVEKNENVVVGFGTKNALKRLAQSCMALEEMVKPRTRVFTVQGIEWETIDLKKICRQLIAVIEEAEDDAVAKVLLHPAKKNGTITLEVPGQYQHCLGTLSGNLMTILKKYAKTVGVADHSLFGKKGVLAPHRQTPPRGGAEGASERVLSAFGGTLFGPTLFADDPLQQRLFQLACEENLFETNTVASFDEFCVVVSRIILWELRCSLYGGFVRDWVVNGEKPNDIDVQVPASEAMDNICQKFIEICAKHKLNATQPQKGKHALKGSVTSATNPQYTIGIDFVSGTLQHLNVDCSAGNLMVYPSHPPTLSLKQKGLQHSVRECLHHVQSRRFHMYISPKDSVYPARVDKYLQKGYQLLNPVPK